MKGFTLIELLVVMSIIGILAAVALPQYDAYIVRAQVTEAMTLMDETKVHVKDYYDHTGYFPNDNATANLPPPEKLIGNYTQKLIVDRGALHLHFGFKSHKKLQNKWLSIRPMVVVDSPNSPISWLCGVSEEVPGMRAIGDNKTDVDRLHLPFACRASLSNQDGDSTGGVE